MSRWEPQPCRTARRRTGGILAGVIAATILLVRSMTAAASTPDICPHVLHLSAPALDFSDAYGHYSGGPDEDASAAKQADIWWARSLSRGFYPDEDTVAALVNGAQAVENVEGSDAAYCRYVTAYRLALTSAPTPQLVSDAAQALTEVSFLGASAEGELAARQMLEKLPAIPGYSERTLPEQKADVWGALAIVLLSLGRDAEAARVLRSYDLHVQPKADGRGLIVLARALLFERSHQADAAQTLLTGALQNAEAETLEETAYRKTTELRALAGLLSRTDQCDQLEPLIETYSPSTVRGSHTSERVHLEAQLLRCADRTRNTALFDRVSDATFLEVRTEIASRLDTGQFFQLGVSDGHFREAAAAVLAHSAERALAGREAERAFDALQACNFDDTSWSMAYLRKIRRAPNESDRRALREQLNAEDIFLRFLAQSHSPSASARDKLNGPETDEIMQRWVNSKPVSFSDGIALTWPKPTSNEIQDSLPSLHEIQSLLRANEALVLIAVDGEQAWIGIVRPRTLAVHTVPLSVPELSDNVGQLRKAIDNPAASFPFSAALRLYAALLAPLNRDFAGTVTRIYWTPAAALNDIPPTVMISRLPTASGDQAFEEASWLARQFEFVTLPAASVMTLSRAANRSAVTGTFVGVGAPVQTGIVAGNPIGDGRDWRGKRSIDDLSALPPLPSANTELRNVAEFFGGRSRLLTGANATEANLRALDLKGAALIDFATHAVSAGELVGLEEPAIVLSSEAHPASSKDDGLLTASEIALMPFDTDWVILSACDTAAITPDLMRSDAGALSGFGRAFLIAGAKSLLVSHWAVASDATTALVTDIVRRWRAGSSQAAALKAAEESMLDDRAHPLWAHPAYWAAFAVVESHPD